MPATIQQAALARSSADKRSSERPKRVSRRWLPGSARRRGGSSGSMAERRAHCSRERRGQDEGARKASACRRGIDRWTVILPISGRARYGRQSCLLWLITIGRRSFAQQTLVKSKQKRDPASSGRLHYGNELLQAAPNSRRTQFQSSVTHHSYWLRGNQKGRIFKASSACIHASLRQRI